MQLNVKPPLGVCIIAVGINYIMTSSSYHHKFGLLYSTYQGFEWVNVSSLPPSSHYHTASE